uniref:Sterol desaturase/sphingolipid hydroxylase, fatty acid hydroxylase superfamily n=1 Tax=Candidatus Kentrum sp. FW TaxID=2126338 RepID=A0A450TYQ9_9GAMM|nr:MAG: Sterol desaturase/sphingolipid hydroxylase, fatty acid hydroxylase superfamily [Candidatus Kentron sp. FW]
MEFELLMVWESIESHEAIIRLTGFVGVFAVMALWEILAPRRQRGFSRWIRWPNNLGIIALDTVVARLLFPTAAVGMALSAEQSGWGLFNLLAIPGWLAVTLSVLILDLTIYLQHILMHAVPALWRLHRMHHTDPECDVTTGIRFHPIEIIISMLIKLTVVGTLGAPALAVLIFEVLLNAMAMFNHGNVEIPVPLDRVMRLFIVTPDMHRVHHSVLPEETNSNFGFNLSIWDRQFDTYRDQPREGHRDMTIGIDQFRARRDLWLDKLLIQPFRDKIGRYAFTARRDPE